MFQVCVKLILVTHFSVPLNYENINVLKNTRYILDSRGLREGPRHLHRGKNLRNDKGCIVCQKKSIDDKKANPVGG